MSSSSSTAASARHRATAGGNSASGSGASRARPVQHGGARTLTVCKELFFAGFPCTAPHPRDAPRGAGRTPASPTYPRKLVRSFFQRYGAVEALYYDEARGMGSVVFADGADAESCYLAVHLSFVAAPDASGEIGQPTWELDVQGESMEERQARPADLLLCLEFAHCCPFVHPVLLTRDVFIDGPPERWEVPGGELSRATLLHRFSLLLADPEARAAAEPAGPVAPHVVVRWVAEPDASAAPAARVEVLDDDDVNGKGGEGAAAGGAQAGEAAAPSRLRRVGPTFPGRGIEPPAVVDALWHMLQPSHVAPADGAAVTVMDLWWEYYQVYMLHKTQPSADRIADAALAYAARPSLVQEAREVQRQSREYAHGDDAAAQQVMQRLVHDNVFHSALNYVHVKQKLRCDPVWASVMRDVYSAKVILHVQAWRALVEESTARAAAADAEAGKRSGASQAGPASPASVEQRRRRTVRQALAELPEPQPTKAQDIAHVAEVEKLWLSLPRTTAAANLVTNVRHLEKIKRGEIDRSGHDKAVAKPPLPALNGSGVDAEAAPGDGAAALENLYPSMSTAQRDEQLYAAVMQNVDGYVATGSAEELLALCEDPQLFRYGKGHIGYEEAHRLPSYWRTYINALWVPLIAFLLLGIGSYKVVDRLGLDKAYEEKHAAQRSRREFHDHLRELVEQQKTLLNKTTTGDAAQFRRAMETMNATMRRASEAAAKAGGKFRVELRQDL